MISGNAGEWAVPGELEYAIRKDAEIKDFLVREHQFAGEGDDGDGTTCALANDYYVLHIRLTEHIVGRYRIWGSDAWLPDMEVSDDMLLNFLKVRIC